MRSLGKIIITCVLLTNSNITYSQTSQEINNEFKKSECKTPDFNVVGKLKENTYEVTFANGFTGSSLYPVWNYDTAILTTKTYQWSTPGKVVNYENPIVVQVNGKIRIKLINGFDKEVPHWVESDYCKGLRSKYIEVMNKEIKIAKEKEDEQKSILLKSQKKIEVEKHNKEEKLKQKKKKRINSLYE